MRRATLQLEAMTRDVFVGVVGELQRSIVEGSELTGAPGQPVDTGALRASWQTVFDSPTAATIGTNLVYAPAIEDGVGEHGPLTLRSPVGGFHSVAHTVTNAGRVVDAVTSRVMSGKGATIDASTGYRGEEGG